jgi:hypothetical protein
MCRPLAIALVLCALPGPARAASVRATAPDAGATEVEDPSIARARQLYEDGKGRFQTADYLGAIELWTEAFTMVPEEPHNARIKALLIYDIATARERAYEVDHDATHLRQAKILMENFAATIPALYGDGPEAAEEEAKATARMNDLARKLEHAEREAKRNRGHGGAGRADLPEDDAAQAEIARKRRAMIASGATLLVLGGAGLGMMAGGLAMGSRANDLSGLDPNDIEGRRAQFERGRTGDRLAIAGGVVGGVLAVTGIVLLAVAPKSSKKNTAVLPTGGSRWAGLAIVGRF